MVQLFDDDFNLHTIAIFIDIEMAFDRVCHNGLLYKLDRDGILNQLGKWIQNYLADRSFQVRCSKTVSSARPI